MLARLMRRALSLGLVLAALALGACEGDDEPTESSVDACSNGRDDDRDGLIDCADPACRAYVFCLQSDAGADAGPVDAGARPDGAVCSRPIDVVLTVDVSSSMAAELASLRDLAVPLVDRVRALDETARVSLVVFIDDALAVAECAPRTGAELAQELESWRVRAPDDRSPVSGTLNQDCAENSLDALALAAGGCAWREGAAHLVVHVTDDTFAERPTVLSGPFGGGIVVQSTYAEALDALVAEAAQVITVTRQGQGESCGAGRSPDVGQGFHTPYQGMVAIPERTGGVALSLPELTAGTLDLAAVVAERAELACTR